ncbi:MAG TPA: tRNA (adenosine(37)-N6)-threonylcarbamoyltransferase complex dimerization subunit type 1 TsaB [Chlorobaculum sp.]|uniref:N(6)-L-threonylcarbamoyladenine synthase n=1 Tax=Chlorobaculum tepidum (strain ATCC 49652 / DSM 12025 / NBRC 103806 / TLS) TaxID=194439 RepID=Q8KG29_CHLTE|nr:tRNA (adenosine(37)-N6)-threonylcarbamoyltransferase complex dimerization subunit type 1 TsaB [Chlorobaculum tepidum]AAM71387.1 protease, putative [Chlorobaculum tepidum TLS]HBU24398.1 tRNA (adenosine(37)-N6)-threonylcarbamoyltransferase complex dimerization subunit type 1 TsaB [Chlorobaculum sp.]
MKILAIECTHGFASAAASNGERMVERRLAEWQKTAESLVPLVMQVMDEAGLTAAELDGVAVSSGPGSFTALRIGLSVAKGIAFGADLPLVPVPTLLAMADAAAKHTATKYIVPVIPSRAGEYFYSMFALKDGALSEIESSRCLVSELPERIAVLTGSLVMVSRPVDLLAEQAPSLAPYLFDASFFSAATLLSHACKSLAEGAAGTATGTLPDYRQAFVPAQRQG